MEAQELTLNRYPKASKLEHRILTWYFRIQDLSMLIALPLLGWFIYQHQWQTILSAALLFFIGYSLRVAGVSFGAHRNLTHPTYSTFRWVKYGIYGLAATAFQGKYDQWATDHIEHHLNADVACDGTKTSKSCDPHTPKNGWWHAQRNWLIRAFRRKINPCFECAVQRFEAAKQNARYKADALKELEQRVENVEIVNFFNRMPIAWLLIGLFVPAIIGAFILSDGGWLLGALLGLYYGGLLAVACCNFTTGLVNSYTHIPGLPGNYRHINNVKDNSHNNILLALLTWCSEFLHANHHVVPDSFNHAIYWYEFPCDRTACTGWILWKIGIFWDVKWTTREKFEEIKEKIDRPKLKNQLVVVNN
jgi:stearoyl-CoA desaturase (delta-9 desaturase)